MCLCYFCILYSFLPVNKDNKIQQQNLLYKKQPVCYQAVFTIIQDNILILLYPVYRFFDGDCGKSNNRPSKQQPRR